MLKLKNWHLALLIFYSALGLLAQAPEKIEVGIYRDINLKQIQLSKFQGSYQLIANDSLILPIDKEDILKISLQNKKIQIIINADELGVFDSLWIEDLSDKSHLTLSPIVPNAKTHIYPHSLFLRAEVNGIYAKNSLHLDDYVAGVVEAETGKDKPYEFYKAQAVISRTYALSNILKGKHINDKFHICDQVHCQVFHGKSIYEQDIPLAVEDTKNLILVGKDTTLVDALFHANCGGQTINSDYVWGKALPYLKSVKDTFCLNAVSASWQKTINKTAWKNYVTQNKFLVNKDSLFYFQLPIDFDKGVFTELINIRQTAIVQKKDTTFNFEQQDRKMYYEYLNYKIPLKQIRTDWQLKSTFFEIEDKGTSNLLFKGKGFGHGVGLCQQGAINMAKTEITFDEILNFYYKDILLITIEDYLLHKLSSTEQQPK